MQTECGADLFGFTPSRAAGASSRMRVERSARAIGRRLSRLWPDGEVRGRTRIRYVQLGASSWSE